MIVFCAVASAAFAQSPPQVHGFLTGRGVRVDAPPSWTTGQFGKFDVGAAEPKNEHLEIAQLGFDWTPVRWMSIHADGIARRESSGTGGSRAGVLQAYVDVFNERWRVRAGSFWLPTSRENIEPMWTSPYTLTHSALNTWIGQEIRPIGVDVQYSPGFYVTAGGTVFRGNDTMGTVLAYRGWSFGSRLSVYGDDLPLPEEGRTTRAIGPDLDGDNGYSGRIRLQLPERAMLQVAYIDNRAELVPLLKGQEPWRSRFNIVSAQLGTTSPTTLAAEWASGWTAIGFPGGKFVLDFDTGYLLLSHKSGANRWTARYDRYSTDVEKGHATTVAWLRDLGAIRVGAEVARVTGEQGGKTVTVEVRYRF